jgi:tight adherence protein B
MRTAFIVLLSLAIVLGLEAAYFAVRSVLQRRTDELKRRLQTLGAPGQGGESSLLRRGRFASNPALGSLLRTLRLAQRTERFLVSANSSLTVAQLWGYSAALAAGALTLTIALGLAFLPLPIFVGFAGGLPALVLAAAADRRCRKISEQLPEALDMMARSLRAGHATSVAFQMVATELPEPVSLEFGRAFEEQRLGLSLDLAILHMTERSPKNRDLKIFATSAIIQKETGGNLAELLSGIAETIRARFRFEGKLRALTAEGRASGVVLALMPIVTVIMLLVVSPEYFRPLVTEPSGRAIAFCTGLTWVAGVVWLHRLTKVDL